MSRLIDADELKTRMLDYYSYSWQLREEIGGFFDNVPTIDLQLQWIPYSEKMPGIGMNAIFTFLTGGYKFVGEGCRRYDDSVWLYRADSMAPKENVLAWMPLPEPYKGG